MIHINFSNKCSKDNKLITDMTEEEYYQYRRCHAINILNGFIFSSILPIIIIFVIYLSGEIKYFIEYPYISGIISIFFVPSIFFMFWYFFMLFFNYRSGTYLLGFLFSLIITGFIFATFWGFIHSL